MIKLKKKISLKEIEKILSISLSNNQLIDSISVLDLQSSNSTLKFSNEILLYNLFSGTILAPKGSIEKKKYLKGVRTQT